MSCTKALPISFLLLATSAAQAQSVRVWGVVEVWYTQMLNDNLRLNAPLNAYAKNARPATFNENTFSIRRTEIHADGTINPEITWSVFIDPNTSTTASPSNLNDVFIGWRMTKEFSLKVGQFKPGITLDSNTAGTGLYFYDRSMMSRQWGEKRDRGIMTTYAVGSAKALSLKLNFGIFNGMADKDFKSNDTNAPKDYMFRMDMAYGTDHKAAIYYREGETDAADKGSLVAGTTTAWGVGAPSATQILDNKDKTTDLGAYYVYDTARWHADADVMTGLLGRRYPTVFNATSNVAREYLGQKYLGFVVSGAYKMGRHWFTARYDHLNYSQGDNWYTATNPYTATLGVNKSPKFSEAIVGYNYLFDPAKAVAGKMKVDFIHRSKNFFLPRVGQSGEQGGDSLVVSFMAGF